MKIHGIIVANSRKNKGRCVVCYDLENKKFIRIISKEERFDHELNKNECQYINGEQIRVRDEVLFYVLDEKPNNPIQPENRYLNTNYKFIFVSRHDARKVKEILENVTDISDYIFYNNYNKIYKKVKMDKSFLLCWVKNLKFYSVGKNGRTNFYKTCKCSFNYKNNIYNNISVTINETKDKDIEELSGKTYSKALVCFSLGKEYNVDNYHYKYLCSMIGYKKEG